MALRIWEARVAKEQSKRQQRAEGSRVCVHAVREDPTVLPRIATRLNQESWGCYPLFSGCNLFEASCWEKARNAPIRMHHNLDHSLAQDCENDPRPTCEDNDDKDGVLN